MTTKMPKEQIKQRVEIFKDAMKFSVQNEMILHPEAFAMEVRADPDYPQQFADHMLEKFLAKKVFFVNETVRHGLTRINVEPSLDGAYEFLGIESPNLAHPELKEKYGTTGKKLRGC